MPTVEENIKMWDSYAWNNGGDDWSSAWGSSDNLWWETIYPRIKNFLNVNCILEIAPGFGRCTQYLKNYCSELIIVDVTEKCIEHCKERFKEDNNIKYYVNDGKSLDMIPDNYVDFVFSWDSLVHVEEDTIKSYIFDINKKLKKDSVAFLHHSNLGEYEIRKEDMIKYNWRASSMSAAKMEQFCNETGLSCIAQEKVMWGGNIYSDSFSLITNKLSKYDIGNKVVYNDGFQNEIFRSRQLSKLYDTEKRYLLDCFDSRIKVNLDLINYIRSKKIIGFGTGEYYKKSNSIYRFNIEYFVDSDERKQNTIIDNKNIYSPTKLLSENKDSVFILIFSQASSYDISEHLLKIGFEFNKNFCFISLNDLKRLKDKNVN